MGPPPRPCEMDGMDHKLNSGSSDAGQTQEKGIGQSLSCSRNRTRSSTLGQRDGKRSRSSGRTDPERILGIVASLASSGSVRELATVLSGSLHQLLHYDIGCLKWAPLDPEEDDWAVETSGEDLTESIAFDHLGNLIEEWEGVDPTQCIETEREGTEELPRSDVYRFRGLNGELVCLRARSVAVVPLNFAGRSFGVLVLISSKSKAFPEGALKGLERVWTVTASRLMDLLDKEVLTSDRDRARVLLDSSDDLLAIWRYDGSVWEVDCNRKVEELIMMGDMTPDRMDGPFFIPPGADLERTECAWKRTFYSGERSKVDVQLPDREGKMRNYMLEFSSLPADGNGTGVIMTGMDLDRIASGIGSVEDENRANRMLLSVLTNSLKDQLCAMMGYSELLSEASELSPEQERFVGRLSGMTSRMNDTVDLADLLFKLRERKVELGLERRDLSRMVQGCLERLRHDAQHYDVVFQRKDSEIELTCSVLIERAITCLMENAMRFSNVGSRIVLDLSTDLNGITFSVADVGEGVPDIYKRTIFERFDGSVLRDGVQGSGLGLSVCRGIVALHKGRIWVEDNKPRGSVFKFFLPWDPEA